MPEWLSLLVDMSAAAAAGDRESVEACLGRLHAGEHPEGAVDEAILQLYLFIGFPATLRVAGAWRRLRGPASDADPLALPETTSAWINRGEAVCREVYGRAYDGLRANIVEMHPALDRWMVMEGYGKVLGRPGLELGHRELCIVTMLAVGGWHSQLHSHLRGARRAAAPDDWIEEALNRGLRRADASLRDAARVVWHGVRQAGEEDADVY